MDQLLLEDLAASPPQQWDEIKRRTDVVRRFIALGSTDPAEVERHAAMLGVGPRMFYNLVRIFRERRSGAPARDDGRIAFKLREDMDSAISEAIAALPPSAIEADARAAAAESCRARGLPEPSFNAVWTRFGRPRASLDLPGRLGIEAEAVLDACAIGVDVVAGPPVPATLVALVDASTGVLIRHRLVAGGPTPEDVVGMLGGADANSAPVVATAAPAALLAREAPSIRLAGVRSDGCKGRRLITGSALRAVFGLKIGRVPLTPRRTEPGGPGVPPPMPLPFVREIVDSLVERRNGELAAG